jgi:hypothetical protein
MVSIVALPAYLDDVRWLVSSVDAVNPPPRSACGLSLCSSHCTYQHHRSKRAGEHSRQIENAYARQGSQACHGGGHVLK